MSTTCKYCARVYVYDHKMGHTYTMCNSCSVNRRRFSLKEKALKFKGGKCLICGYSKCAQALHFHHVEKKDKDFSISGNHSKSWKSIEAELLKCILVCANCHSEIHAGLHNIKLD